MTKQETDSERNLRLALGSGSQVVGAVGFAVGLGMHHEDPKGAERILSAMHNAHARATEAGMNDADLIRERVLAARDAARG